MATVLIVDDSPVDRRVVGGLLGKSPTLEVDYASDGEEALVRMAELRPNLVVTDLIMPNMDGLELVAAVVKDYPLVPVILMTGKGSEKIAVDALKAGASSYVPKSVLQDLLLDTVENLLAMAYEEQTQVRMMDCMTGCRFSIDNDVTMISALINYLRRFIRQANLCDETSGIRTCVALEEALNNALYHGNLELDSQLREGDRAAYRSLVEERRHAEPYKSRKIHVAVRVEPDHGAFIISDEGPGFDPRELPDPTDPTNLEKPSGRGLLLMRTFMDEVAYNEEGNQVTLVKRRNNS
ncbi:MAG: ATP-binding protein [Planctomycetes bacterium]|nr:ATP-binding protein [Planctomycetota bacterium]